MLEELGFGRNKFQSSYKSSHVSIVLHHLLKELPSELVSSQAMEILHIIKCSNDYSFSQVVFFISDLNKPCNPFSLTLPVMLYCFVEQILNYRLLGNRLCEGSNQAGFLSSLINEVIQVLVFPFSFNKIRISLSWFFQSLCACAVGDILTYFTYMYIIYQKMHLSPL